MRHYTFIDKLLCHVETAAKTLVGEPHAARTNPGDSEADVELTAEEAKHSAGLMRINHTGEVCAQALYEGHLLVARSDKTREMLQQACKEEIDHLQWTQQRLTELNSHRSYLNLFWYTHSYLIGVFAGIAGDRWSLGFVEETEAQVTRHLDGHLGELPAADLKSRKIVEQMRIDEIQHGESAKQAGAAELPGALKKLMQLQAKVMTTLVYYF